MGLEQARRVVRAQARAKAWEKVVAWLHVLQVDAPGLDDPEAIRELRRTVVPAVVASWAKCSARTARYTRKVEG